MAKKSMIAREVKRIKTVAKYANRRTSKRLLMIKVYQVKKGMRRELSFKNFQEMLVPLE